MSTFNVCIGGYVVKVITASVSAALGNYFHWKSSTVHNLLNTKQQTDKGRN